MNSHCRRTSAFITIVAVFYLCFIFVLKTERSQEGRTAEIALQKSNCIPENEEKKIRQKVESTHFTFTLHQQPVGTSTYFNIRVQKIADPSFFVEGIIGSDCDTVALQDALTKKMKPAPIEGNKNNSKPGNMTTTACMERVVCTPIQNQWVSHFPHFAQSIFPCWSALLRFPPGKRYMRSRVMAGRSGWNEELIQAFQDAGVKMIGEKDEVSEECDWEVIIPPFGDGWPVKDKNKNKWRESSTNYFSRPSDMAELQRIILGSSYINGVSNETKIKLLILNRDGTRRFPNGRQIASSIKDSSFGDVMNVVYIQNMKRSLRDQALIMHTADIIISPHGAQLTNLAFIKPCTVVVEVYPTGYYVHFFQAYVIAAGGIAFEGYEEGRSPFLDLRGIENDRGPRRDVPRIPMSVASVMHALPELVLKYNSCGYHFKNNS